MTTMTDSGISLDAVDALRYIAQIGQDLIATLPASARGPTQQQLQVSLRTIEAHLMRAEQAGTHPLGELPPL